MENFADWELDLLATVPNVGPVRDVTEDENASLESPSELGVSDSFTIENRVFPLAHLREAVDWKRDCQSIPDSVFVSFQGALEYVERNYPGGWDAFVTECCTFVQL